MTTPLGALRTVIGPLTTAFTPPLSCATPVVDSTYSNADLCCTANCPYVGNSAQDDPACWPDSTSPAPTTAYGARGFYSPAYDCPQGYIGACTATASDSVMQWQPQFQMLAGETAVGCCSSGFACTVYDGFGQYQVSMSAASPTGGELAVASCTGATAAEVLTITLDAGAQAFSIYQPMIEVRWRAVDLSSGSASSQSPLLSPSDQSIATIDATSSSSQRSLLSSASASVATVTAVLTVTAQSDPEASNTSFDNETSSTKSTTLSTTYAQTPPSTTSTDVSSKHPSPTSAGVIAGSTIGAVAVLALIIAAMWYAWHRKKRAHQALLVPQSYSDEPDPNVTQDGRAEAKELLSNAVHEIGEQRRPEAGELLGRPVHEMDGHRESRADELHGNAVHELAQQDSRRARRF